MSSILQALFGKPYAPRETNDHTIVRGPGGLTKFPNIVFVKDDDRVAIVCRDNRALAWLLASPPPKGTRIYMKFLDPGALLYI